MRSDSGGDINNLGEVMKNQSDLIGARTMFERATQDRRSRFGPDHPNVAIECQQLGDGYESQDDLAAHVRCTSAQ